MPGTVARGRGTVTERLGHALDLYTRHLALDEGHGEPPTLDLGCARAINSQSDLRMRMPYRKSGRERILRRLVSKELR
jgi:hypothetical protein